MKGKYGIKQIIRIISIAVMVVVIMLIIKDQVEGARQRRKQQELIVQAQTIYQSQNNKTEALESTMTTEAQTLKPQKIIMDRFKSLYEKNQDLIGWIKVDGTNINNPIVTAKDNEYYLEHDFEGAKSKYGCLFVKNYADVDTPGTNVIIYGHDMRDGLMFGDIDEWKEEGFYQEHKTISFATLYEERNYEIVSVFLSQVYMKNEDVFKYYEFYEADTPEEFSYFYNNIKELALYDTGVTAEYGDTFITLSTCAYHVQDGRMVIVAKKLEK